MDKPRVFISHSALNEKPPEGAPAGQKPEALELLDMLSEALDDEFAVRVDKDDLVLGSNWRNTLSTWIGRCDAAVVLLSEKALRSPFVAYEVSVLTARPNVTVIPVFLTGVDYNKVQDSPLGPSDIHRLQSIVAEPDQARRVERVKEKLAEVKRSMTPVDWRAARLEQWLMPIGPTAARQYLQEFGAEPDPWEPGDSAPLDLALLLMSLGLEEATPLIRNILDTLSRQGTLRNVFELVATSWVDVGAAERIKEVSTGEPEQRALALNVSDLLFAEIYTRCASRLAANSWPLAPIPGITGEKPFDELRQQIEERLISVIGPLEEGETLEGLLELLDENKEPVFVTLPAAGVNGPLLEALRKAFPTVTFFFLAGGGEADQQTYEEAEVKFVSPSLQHGLDVKFITPPLHWGFEDKFRKLYRGKWRYLTINRPA